MMMQAELNTAPLTAPSAAILQPARPKPCQQGRMVSSLNMLSWERATHVTSSGTIFHRHSCCRWEITNGRAFTGAATHCGHEGEHGVHPQPSRP
jgi:hypothetical protein